MEGEFKWGIGKYSVIQLIDNCWSTIRKVKLAEAVYCPGIFHVLYPHYSGFIGFAYPESAEDAFVGLNGTKVDGKSIKIDFPGRKTPVSRLVVKNLPTVSLYNHVYFYDHYCLYDHVVSYSLMFT